MVSAQQPQLEAEPSEEFDKRCVTVAERWRNGDLPFREAIAQLTIYVQEATASGHFANQARAEQILGYIQHYRGNLNTSIQHVDRARTLYKKVGNLSRMAMVELNQGENYRFKGDFSRALLLYRSALETAEQLDDLRLRTIATINEGLTLLALDQNSSARRALEGGLALAGTWTEKLDDLPAILCEAHHGMAVIHLRQGAPETAWSHALLSLESAGTSGQPLQRGYANRILGEVVTELKSIPDPDFSDDPDVYFRAAMEAFREINAEAELARTMFAQATSLAKRGRRTTAARKLQQVMIIFTRLGMVDDAARAAEAQLAVI